MELPLLWHFPISHFNEKARWALDYKRIPHRRKALGPSYLPRAWWATGRGTLPVLFLEGRAIGDSTRIIEALERYRPEPPLYPAGETDRRRALELEDFFDEELGHPLRSAVIGPLLREEPDAAIRALTTGMGAGARRTMRVVFPVFRRFYEARHRIEPARLERDREKVRAALDRIRTELRPSGYLVGDSFSVADLTAAALFAPIRLPSGFPYPPEGQFPQLFVEYRASLSQHPAWEWIEEIYRRHRGTSAEVR